MKTSPTPQESIGFLGAGALTDAVVRGLRRDGSTAPAIVLSPRGEAVSRRLADEVANVVRARSNDEVIDACGTVCLAIRPQQLDAALSGLRFREGQTVVSFVAAVTAAEIARLVSPATAVCRVIPLASVAERSGPIALYPRIESVAGLFGRIGEVVEARSEAEIMAMGAATGLISSYFALQGTIIAWLEGEGLEPAAAARYTRSLLASLAAASGRVSPAELAALPAGYETKGGLNERTRRRLTEAGWLGAVTEALDTLIARSDLRGEGKGPGGA